VRIQAALIAVIGVAFSKTKNRVSSASRIGARRPAPTSPVSSNARAPRACSHCTRSSAIFNCCGAFMARKPCSTVWQVWSR
jgi:hypothetical protein